MPLKILTQIKNYYYPNRNYKLLIFKFDKNNNLISEICFKKNPDLSTHIIDSTNKKYKYFITICDKKFTIDFDFCNGIISGSNIINNKKINYPELRFYEKKFIVKNHRKYIEIIVDEWNFRYKIYKSSDLYTCIFNICVKVSNNSYETFDWFLLKNINKN